MGDQRDPILAALLKRLREERGITQEQIAFDAGITASALSRIERGINKPGWMTVMQIVQALGIGLAELATDYELAASEQRTKEPG